MRTQNKLVAAIVVVLGAGILAGCSHSSGSSAATDQTFNSLPRNANGSIAAPPPSQQQRSSYIPVPPGQIK